MTLQDSDDQPRATIESLGRATEQWTKPETRHLSLQPAVAKAFALTLDEQRQEFHAKLIAIFDYLVELRKSTEDPFKTIDEIATELISLAWEYGPVEDNDDQ